MVHLTNSLRNEQLFRQEVPEQHFSIQKSSGTSFQLSLSTGYTSSSRDIMVHLCGAGPTCLLTPAPPPMLSAAVSGWHWWRVSVGSTMVAFGWGLVVPPPTPVVCEVCLCSAGLTKIHLHHCCLLRRKL